MDPIAASRSACRFEGFRLDRRERQLSIVDGVRQVPVTIGSRSMEILLVLVSRAGEIVSKNDLMDAVWPGVAVEENNLTVQVSALRRVLDAGKQGPSIIQTVPGRGYRFVGPVVEDATTLAPSSLPLAGPDLEAPAKPAPPVGQPRRRRYSALALLVMALAAAVVLWPADDRVFNPRSLSIVLIPFTGATGDDQAVAVAAAMTDELGIRLTKLPGAFVVLAKPFPVEADQAPGLRQAARQSGVRYALAGTVRRIGPDLQIVPRLTDAATGAQRPTEPLRTAATSLADIRQNVIFSFTEAIAGTLLDAEADRIEAIPFEQREAADLLLQVNAAMRHVVGPEQNKRLVGLLERAIALHPRAPEALVTLANLLVRPAMQDNATLAPDRLHRAQQLIGEARTLAPGRTSVLIAQATMLRAELRWAEAAAAYRQLLDRLPDSAVIRNQVALCEIALGHSTVAVGLLREALRLAPDQAQSFLAEYNLGRALVYLGQDEEALLWLRRARQHYPTRPVGIAAYMAAAYAQLGQTTEARLELKEFVDKQPSATLSRLLRRQMPTPEAAQEQRRLAAGLALAGLPEGLDFPPGAQMAPP